MHHKSIFQCVCPSYLIFKMFVVITWVEENLRILILYYCKKTYFMTPFTFLLLRVTKCNHEKTSQPRSAYSAFSWQNHVLFVSFFGNVEESRTKHVIQKTSLVHITAILHYCNFFMAHYAPIIYATLCIYHDNHRKILAFIQGYVLFSLLKVNSFDIAASMTNNN